MKPTGNYGPEAIRDTLSFLIQPPKVEKTITNKTAVFHPPALDIFQSELTKELNIMGFKATFCSS